MNLDIKLSENFTLREVVEWPKHQSSMTSSDRAKAIQMSTNALDDSAIARARLIAEEMQILRNEANAAFPQFGGNIGIRALSWLRPIEWEIYRKRSGGSEHTNAHAVDFIVVGIPQANVPGVMTWIWSRLRNWRGGLARKMSGNSWVFIHIDLGSRRRWTY